MMKKFWKKIATGIVLICVMLTMLPPSVVKAEGNFDSGQHFGVRWITFAGNAGETYDSWVTTMDGSSASLKSFSDRMLFVDINRYDDSGRAPSLDTSRIKVVSSNEEIVRIELIDNESASYSSAAAFGNIRGHVGDAVVLKVYYDDVIISSCTLTIVDSVDSVYENPQQIEVIWYTYTETEGADTVWDWSMTKIGGKTTLLSLPENGKLHISMRGFDANHNQLLLDFSKIKFEFDNQQMIALEDAISALSGSDAWGDIQGTAGDAVTLTAYYDGALISTCELTLVDAFENINDGEKPAEPETPADTINVTDVSQIISIDDEEIVITDGSKVLPDDAILTTKKVTAGKLFDTVKKVVEAAISKLQDFRIFEFDLTKSDGTVIHQLDGFVQVELPVPADMPLAAGMTYKVYRVDDGRLIACDTSVKSGKIFFETNHFSTYVVTVEPESVQETSPKTGEKSLGLYYIAFVLFGGISLICLIGYRKKLL